MLAKSRPARKEINELMCCVVSSFLKRIHFNFNSLCDCGYEILKINCDFWFELVGCCCIVFEFGHVLSTWDESNRERKTEKESSGEAAAAHSALKIHFVSLQTSISAARWHQAHIFNVLSLMFLIGIVRFCLLFQWSIWGKAMNRLNYIYLTTILFGPLDMDCLWLELNRINE